MSIALMSAAFASPVAPVQKLVLLALCDSANDSGMCFPSVPTLCEKTSLSERAVQGAVAELEEAGYLRRDFRQGRSTIYWMTPAGDAPPQQVHPRSRCTPPPQDVHPTPAPHAPHPRTSCTHNRKGTVKEPKEKQVAEPAAPTPPAPFLGDENLESLNGKSVVPLAAAWELPMQWGMDAEALGWKPGEVLKHAEMFRQYWVSGKGMGTRRSVKGWRQSWSNWLSKAERFKR